MVGQDRGQRPRERTLAEVWTTSPFSLPPVGPNGIYLFELEAQPGGPEGRSDTTAGSKPIDIIERPRSVPALRSCLFWVVVGTRIMVSSRRHFVPNPVLSMRTVFAPNCNSPSPLFLHTRYDSVGNRTYRQDLTAESNSQNLDEVYAYDGVNQLLSSTRGHWEYGDPENDSFIADAAELSQSWQLDATGNWDSVTTGETTQGRDYTLANELTTADDWVTSVYDQNGNMTTMPQPSDPTKAFHLTWDAWNRLVKVSETVDMEEQTVVEYAYDGANRRILKTTYAEGEPSETRHFYQKRKTKCWKSGWVRARCRPAIRLGPALYRRSCPPRPRQQPQRRPDRRLLWHRGFRPRPAPLRYPRRQLERCGRG